MNIYSWNVNGIRAVIRKGEFEKFIQEYQPDILCLQETKAEQGQAVIDMPEYEEYWNSAAKKGYSGTAIFTKYTPLRVINDFPDSIAARYDFTDSESRDAHGEGRIITAEFEDFYVVTVYTPNSKDDLSRLSFRHTVWDPAFYEYMVELEQHKPVIICGDLNVAHTEDDLANPKQSVGKHGFTDEEREGIAKLINAGFIDSFRLFTQGNQHYTWWTAWGGARMRNAGWRIDYFLASQKLKNRIVSADIHDDVMGSDHCPVSITLED